ncbi:hypothetical protein Tco_1106051 [Tanacetum coccineum]
METKPQLILHLVSTKNFTVAAKQQKKQIDSLNIVCIPAIPDRHLLVFHDVTNAKTYGQSIKARVRVMKHQEEFKRTFETTILDVLISGSREELDSHTKGRASKHSANAPNCASHVSTKSGCSFFAQQASMPTTLDDEDLLQIDEDNKEEI